MARKPISEKRAEIQGKIEGLQDRLTKIEANEMERIAKIAKKCGLLDLSLSNAELEKEFTAIAARFPEKGRDPQSPSKKQSA